MFIKTAMQAFSVSAAILTSPSMSTAQTLVHLTDEVGTEYYDFESSLDCGDGERSLTIRAHKDSPPANGRKVLNTLTGPAAAGADPGNLRQVIISVIVDGKACDSEASLQWTDRYFSQIEHIYEKTGSAYAALMLVQTAKRRDERADFGTLHFINECRARIEELGGTVPPFSDYVHYVRKLGNLHSADL
ncbi:MAG TPA: hypothetical protein EYO33_32395, partial [Phycisphaerales bacterium]|nr:hypothetical protein [Phycisphaerales bacterium]